MTFRDSEGYLHDKRVTDKDLETSENAPLYDGYNIALSYHWGVLFSNEAWSYCHRVNMLYGGEWYTTPVSLDPEMSHDNWKGVFMGLECCEKKAKEWNDTALYLYIQNIKKRIPIFHKQLDHPRDFLLVIGFKYKWLRPFTFWASKLAAVISMYQTHKHKGTQAKTDGKIIGKGLCLAFNWKWTEYLLDMMLPMKRETPLPDNAWHLVSKHHDKEGNLETWSWDSWFNIHMDYFNDTEHPNVGLSENL